MGTANEKEVINVACFLKFLSKKWGKNVPLQHVMTKTINNSSVKLKDKLSVCVCVCGTEVRFYNQNQ